jgi:hypothetical protein
MPKRFSTEQQVVQSFPNVSVWQQTWAWIQMALLSMAPHYDAGGRLIEHFFRAGLPQPTLFCDRPIGGGKDSPLYAWSAETLDIFMPQLVRMGILVAGSISIEMLETRIRTAALEKCSQFVGPAQYCAWTRIPSSPR